MPSQGWVRQSSPSFSLRAAMQLSLRTLALLAVPAHFSVASPVHGSPEGRIVRNDAFAVQGTSWPNNTDVDFFGNIPYAEPPIGARRFRPPVTKAPTPDTVINGSWFGPSCVQYSNGGTTVYSQYLTGFLLSPGQTQDEGAYARYRLACGPC